MQLFEIGERVEEGIPFHAEPGTHRFLLGQAYDHFIQIPLDRSLTDPLLRLSNQESRNDLYVMRARVVARNNKGELSLRISREEERDTHALVRVDIAPGRGGLIEYTSTVSRDTPEGKKFDPFPPPGVKILGEGVYAEQTPEYPVYLLVMEDGAEFRVARTGELEEAATELVVRWTREFGLEMAPEHLSVGGDA